MVLEAAHNLMRLFSSDPSISAGVDTAELLDETLEDVGFSGLWRASAFHSSADQDRQCALLTDRLIEVSFLQRFFA